MQQIPMFYIKKEISKYIRKRRDYMDIELFNEFLVLAQTLNYSKAAQQLYLSQSVLSRHIQNLENHLGVALLSRNKHSVELTAIG